jgi:hypothetical protein
MILPTGGLDGVEETNELLMAMALHAAADHLALDDIEGGEQRGRAMALVVVGHCASPPLLHRQPGLGSVERLDLRFLVDREHDRVRRWVDVKANDLAQLGDEFRVLRELEPTHPVRLQAVRLPDPLHRGNADPGCLTHHAGGPVGRLAGRILRRQGDYALDDRGIERFAAGRAGLVAQQPVHPFLHEPPCQRHTTDLLRPVPRITALVPNPAAVSRMILARQTCFCGLFRFATTASRRVWLAAVTLTTIPLRMR